jgi:hypothetical protein
MPWNTIHGHLIAHSSTIKTLRQHPARQRCELQLKIEPLGRHTRGSGWTDWFRGEKASNVHCDLQAKVHGEMSN